MPYATNALDETQIYFEDEGGEGPAVIFHGGILDAVETLRMSPISQALNTDEFRLVYTDHRGLGHSDKPHDPAAYAMPLRVADAVALLDELGIDRAHFIGTSWGGRLGFGIGEHAPERVRSLIIGGQQPYAIDPDGPLTRVVGEGIVAARTEGIAAFVRALENFSDTRFPDTERAVYLQNDPAAIEAAWRSAIDEGDIVSNLNSWEFPCLIFTGGKDDDFREQARLAASEIPNGEFIALAEQDHVGAHLTQDAVIPAILRVLRSAK